MFKRSLNAAKGVLLAEIIVAVGILSVCLFSLICFFANAAILNENSRNTTTALSHAQYVLEDIRGRTYAAAAAQLATQAWTWDPAGIAAQDLTPLRNESVTTTSTGTEPLTVNTTVDWNDAQDRPRRLSLFTIVGGP